MLLSALSAALFQAPKALRVPEVPKTSLTAQQLTLSSILRRKCQLTELSVRLTFFLFTRMFQFFFSKIFFQNFFNKIKNLLVARSTTETFFLLLFLVTSLSPSFTQNFKKKLLLNYNHACKQLS